MFFGAYHPASNHSCRIMWVYLEHIADLLQSVSKVLSVASSGDIETLRHELQTARRKNSQSSTPSSAQLPHLSSTRIPDVTGKRLAPV